MLPEQLHTSSPTGWFGLVRTTQKSSVRVELAPAEFTRWPQNPLLSAGADAVPTGARGVPPLALGPSRSAQAQGPRRSHMCSLTTQQPRIPTEASPGQKGRKDL